MGGVLNVLNGCAWSRLGLDLNQQRSSDGCTAMHLAVWYKQSETLAILRALGADARIKNNYGESVEELIRVRESCNNIVSDGFNTKLEWLL